MDKDYHRHMVELLRARNGRETYPFAPMVSGHYSLLLRESELKRHTDALESEVQQLRIRQQDVREQRAQEGLLGGTVQVASGRMSELEGELNKVREELTNSLKQNAANMRSMLQLTQQVKDKARECSKKAEEAAMLRLERDRAHNQIKVLKDVLSEKDSAFEHLQQEKHSIRKDYLVKEHELKKLKAEYNALLDRWLMMKNEEAEKLNTMNEMLDAINVKHVSGQNLERGREEIESARERLGDRASILDATFEGALLTASQIPEKPRRNFVGHGGEINSVDFNPSGSTFATASNDKYIKIWDSRTGSQNSVLSGSIQSVMNVRYSMSGEMILGASNDHATRIWGTSQCRIRHTLTGHIGKVYAAEFSGDGSKVVSGSHDRSLKIWDLSRGYCTKTIFCFSSCNDLALASESSMVCSGHYDGSVRLWDMNGECAHVFDRLHDKQITSVRKHPAGGMSILTSGRDDCLKIVDVRTHETVQRFSHPSYRSGINWQQVAFSPDGQYVAAGSADGGIYIWNTTSGDMERVLTKGHNKTTVTCVAWHPDGRQMVSCDRNGNIVLWE